MQFTLTWQSFVAAAAIIGAILALIGYLRKIFGWVESPGKNRQELNVIKTELTLIVYGLQACLDGLQQLGANHTVPIAKEKLDKYINQLAHDQLKQ